MRTRKNPDKAVGQCACSFLIVQDRMLARETTAPTGKHSTSCLQEITSTSSEIPVHTIENVFLEWCNSHYLKTWSYSVQDVLAGQVILLLYRWFCLLCVYNNTNQGGNAHIFLYKSVAKGYVFKPDLSNYWHKNPIQTVVNIKIPSLYFFKKWKTVEELVKVIF